MTWLKQTRFADDINRCFDTVIKTVAAVGDHLHDDVALRGRMLPDVLHEPAAKFVAGDNCARQQREITAGDSVFAVDRAATDECSVNTVRESS